MSQHLMIDLETGGTSPGCAVFSIGACIFNPFDLDQSIEHTFYEEISHTSCMELGLRFERSTMDWWRSQGDPPNGSKHISQVIEEFNTWIGQLPSKTKRFINAHWANSPSFDISILKHLFQLKHLNWPYPYYQERDVRTLKSIALPNYKLDNSHNALEDAKNQALLVQHCYLELGLSTHATRHSNESRFANPGNNVPIVQN